MIRLIDSAAEFYRMIGERPPEENEIMLVDTKKAAGASRPVSR